MRILFERKVQEKMTKDKQIEEMAKIYEDARYNANETLGSMNEGAGKWYAKAFYNAGYRKTFTSEFASDTQKAFKEGYAKGSSEAEAYAKIIKMQDEEISLLRGELLKKENLEESYNKSRKSIEKKYEKAIEKAKTELARKIFEEIEAIFEKSNMEICLRQNHTEINTTWNMLERVRQEMHGVGIQVVRLKNKYTEVGE